LRKRKMGSRTTIEVAVRFREPSWIIASGGGIGRMRGLDVGFVLRQGHSESIVFGTHNQLKSADGAAPHRPGLLGERLVVRAIEEPSTVRLLPALDSVRVSAPRTPNQ
jgi:hypothetical protein